MWKINAVILLQAYKLLMNIGVLFCSIFILLMPMLYLIIGRVFDKKFKHRTIGFLEQGPLGFLWRMNMYATCIIFPKRVYKNKFSYASLMYAGFDFRNHSNWFQISICYIYCLSIVIGCSSGSFAGILQYAAKHWV